MPFDLLAKTTTTTAHTTPPIITSQIHPESPDDVDVGGGIVEVDEVDADDDDYYEVYGYADTRTVAPKTNDIHTLFGAYKIIT